MKKKKLDLLEMNGQVYISFGYIFEDDLLEIELEAESSIKKGSDKDGTNSSRQQI